MPAVSGLGTTFNLPNYHGELLQVTPTETPLLSAAGGLNGGGRTVDGKSFEWQTEDLRDPEMRPRVEGADAPASEERARANVENVVQIFQEAVSTSYTKQAATGQYATASSAPYESNSGGANPVGNEHAHQVMLALKTIARDVNYAFWHSKLVKPTTNATARQTAGLLSVIASNRVATGEVTGLTTGAANIVNETGTSVANGDKVVFTVPPAELRADRAYFVVSKATDSFKVAATSGGGAITIATGQSGIAYVPAKTDVTADGVNELMQSVFDNGGISEQATATLFVPSRQKRALTKAYATSYGNAQLLNQTRSVGGVSMDTIVTDFGTLNVAIDRALPPDAIVVVSVEQVQPAFLPIPGKGVLFEEALAKTGASDKTQIYGEIGLEYGNEAAHGVLRGLTV